MSAARGVLSVRAMTFLQCMLGLMAFVVVVTACDGSVGATDCMCVGPVVDVVVEPGIAPADVVSIASTSPDVCAPEVTDCGTDGANCSDLASGHRCNSDQATCATRGFSIPTTAKTAGTCAIRVTLKDGTVHTGTTHVSVRSGCCRGMPLGDAEIAIAR